MSKAWPLLRSLTLDNLTLESLKMTSAGLIPVVKHCRNLEVLNLVVRFQPVETSLLDGVSNPSIQKLLVWGPSIMDVTRNTVALFPDIYVVRRNYEDENSYKFTRAIRADRLLWLNRIL